MTSHQNLESNQIEIEKDFCALWQSDAELQSRVKNRVEKFRAYLSDDSLSPSNQGVQAILVAQNTFLVIVKTVLEKANPDFSSEEWLELEDEFHQDMRRGDRGSNTVQIFRQMAEAVYALVEPDTVRRDRELSELWEMVKIYYRKQTAAS